MTKEMIEHLKLTVGNKEYNSDDIFNSKELNNFIKRSLIVFPMSFMLEAIKENGFMRIITDEHFENSTFRIENVSNDLRDRFNKTYNLDSLDNSSV
ncbi:hypothetical protein [Lutibacter sp.]|uniref:hypothetical protein n=1 Tax=Lutibacter sp. TaxID=1925666 RepID=UPI00273369AB|nr:hypothetical protein [Lutibacter sp.]MDP3313782.1 hypothetical protein [Lutibacter sp.]